jgi:hypothetical protein
MPKNRVLGRLLGARERESDRKIEDGENYTISVW